MLNITAWHIASTTLDYYYSLVGDKQNKQTSQIITICSKCYEEN